MNFSRAPLRAPALALALLMAATGLTLSTQAHATKRGSGVSVEAAAPKTLRAGETGTLTLKLGQVTAQDGASVEVRNPTTGKLLYSSRLNRGELRTIEVPIAAERDGVQYLDIITRQGTRASVKSVSVAVGGAAPQLKREGSLTVTPSGERVISMPAQQ
jgi:hypothetical protein